jgi:acyl carrier protein
MLVEIRAVRSVLVITLNEVSTLIRREARGKIDAGTVIDENTKLRDLGLSSLQIAEIVFTLEEEHEVEFDPARAADAETLGDLLALGNEALSAGAGH